MNTQERVRELEKALMLPEDVHVRFVMLYCNGCGDTLAVDGRQVSFELLGEELARRARDWVLGDIYEEADFCPVCVAKRVA